MIKTRFIPCLLLKDSGLVKTIKFNKARYIGDPINAIKIFNDKEVDELMVLDITATSSNKGPNYNLIERFASECFMPLAYGGGIHSLDQAKKLFALGVEKICIQSAALSDTSLITKLSNNFGSQSIIVSIDVKKNLLNKHKLFSCNSKKTLSLNWEQHLQNVVSLGAGEILLNSVDKDGTMTGMDLELIEKASNLVSVPIIACGGVGSLSDIKDGVKAGASAIAAGSFFVFHGPLRAVLISYPNYREIDLLFK